MVSFNFSLITTSLLVYQIVASNNQLSGDKYFSNFEKNLKELTKHVQPPKNQTSRSFEYSNIIPGNEREGKFYARFAGATYCDDYSLINWNCAHCNAVGSKVEKVRIFEDDNTETKGFVAVNKNRGEIVISFRGSSNLQNWLVNAQIGKTGINFNGRTYSVHRGFKGVTDALYPKVASIIKPLLASNPNYNVVVTGHSLGAAVADLVALRIKYSLKVRNNRLKLYTYGAPRVGDEDFARFVNGHQFTIGRFVNANDVVPHLPPQLTDYSHHQQEFWVNGMHTQLCGTEYLEDPDCSYQEWSNPSTRAHRIMWNIPLGNGSC